MRFHPSTQHGYSKSKLRLKKKQYNLENLVQIHHVVPRSLKKHPILLYNCYNVEEDYNLILLPTYLGKDVLNLRLNRPIHDGGHISYNYFVKERLDSCNSLLDFLVILKILHKGCRGYLKIPWY